MTVKSVKLICYAIKFLIYLILYSMLDNIFCKITLLVDYKTCKKKIGIIRKQIHLYSIKYSQFLQCAIKFTHTYVGTRRRTVNRYRINSSKWILKSENVEISGSLF